jgi:hypothetical protein
LKRLFSRRFPAFLKTPVEEVAVDHHLLHDSVYCLGKPNILNIILYRIEKIAHVKDLFVELTDMNIT